MLNNIYMKPAKYFWTGFNFFYETPSKTDVLKITQNKLFNRECQVSNCIGCMGGFVLDAKIMEDVQMLHRLTRKFTSWSSSTRKWNSYSNLNDKDIRLIKIYISNKGQY